MTTITIPPRKPIKDDYLTIPEIFFLTGQKRGTVEHWRIRYEGTPLEFPEPDDAVGYTPVWHLSRILAWIDLLNESRKDHLGKPQVKYDVAKWRAHKAAGGFRRQLELGAARKAKRRAAK